MTVGQKTPAIGCPSDVASARANRAHEIGKPAKQGASIGGPDKALPGGSGEPSGVSAVVDQFGAQTVAPASVLAT
jgi:hypothetical protein